MTKLVPRLRPGTSDFDISQQIRGECSLDPACGSCGAGTITGHAAGFFFSHLLLFPSADFTLDSMAISDLWGTPSVAFRLQPRNATDRASRFGNRRSEVRSAPVSPSPPRSRCQETSTLL